MPDPARVPAARPYDAVLFDFADVLASPEDPVAWVTAAAATCGHQLDRGRATALADRFLLAGRPGGPPPQRVPPHLAEYWGDRDLDPHAHQAAYTGLAATVDCGIDGLPEALYARALDVGTWRPVPEAAATLQALRGAGLAVAVVCNVGYDLRPHGGACGLDPLVDAWVLSCEVGRTKPDPVIFYRATAQLRVDPERTLVVGRTAADAGAAAVGCTAVVLPTDSGGGLQAVRLLTAC